MPITILPKLSEVIASIESNGLKSAIRFEPSLHDRSLNGQSHINFALTNIALYNRCTLETARVISCTSWGLFQLMGFNLYNPPISLKVPILEFVSNEDMQGSALNAFLDHNSMLVGVATLRDDLQERLDFARKYNGPAETSSYAAKLYAAIIRLSKEVPGPADLVS